MGLLGEGGEWAGGDFRGENAGEVGILAKKTGERIGIKC